MVDKVAEAKKLKLSELPVDQQFRAMSFFARELGRRFSVFMYEHHPDIYQKEVEATKDFVLSQQEFQL